MELPRGVGTSGSAGKICMELPCGVGTSGQAGKLFMELPRGVGTSGQAGKIFMELPRRVANPGPEPKQKSRPNRAAFLCIERIAPRYLSSAIFLVTLMPLAMMR